MKKIQDIPLITEPHPDTWDGYPFITLIGYNDENVLTVVDNVVNKQVVAYVLDLCEPAGISKEAIINAAADWFYSGRNRLHPLSIEFSRLGVALAANTVLRCFPIEFVTRVIGPLPSYPMGGTLKVRRKKRKAQ
jgi:hypothetical protein